jgi:hypothetical protein
VPAAAPVNNLFGMKSKICSGFAILEFSAVHGDSGQVRCSVNGTGA